MNFPTRPYMEEFIRGCRWEFNPKDFPEYHVPCRGNPATEFCEWIFIGFNRLLKRMSYDEVFDLFILCWLIYRYTYTATTSITTRRMTGVPVVSFTGMTALTGWLVTNEPARWTLVADRAIAIASNVSAQPGFATV